MHTPLLPPVDVLCLLAGNLFVKTSLPSNATAAALEYEDEMLDLFADTDLIGDELDAAIEAEDAIEASALWHDYSGIFPALQEKGQSVVRSKQWSFVSE